MPLFRWFIVRRLRREPLRSVLTITGVALGVAVVLAIHLANQSALGGFRASLDTVAGRTSLEISGAGVGVDETRLAILGWLSEWGDVSPVIEGDALALVDGGSGEAVHVLGVDILQDQPLREYRLANKGKHPQPTVAELLKLLVDPSSVIVTEVFAQRHGLATGSPLDLVVGDKVTHAVIAGLLSNEGPARLIDGNFVLMDIAAAQWAFDRLGRVDRIDVRLADPSRLDEAERAIAARLPEGLMVQRPARRGAQVERMLAAFQFNLGALSLVALLVGLFLVYNTIATSVIARRDEIGMLRAVGTGRRRVLALFLGEAAALGVAGCVLGVPMGQVFAWGAVRLTSATVATLYVTEAARVPSLALWQVAAAFWAGVPLSVLAALAPALEASRVSPLDALRSAGRSAAWRRPGWRAPLASLLCLVGAAWAARQGPIDGLPVLGFAAAVLIVFGAAFLVPALLVVFGRLAPRSWPVLAVEGRLAVAAIAGSIPRVAVSVAALATSLAMLVAIAVMIGSFRQTVDYWVGQTLQADLFVATGRRSNLEAQPTISADLQATVSHDPDVELVDGASSVNLRYRDRLIVVGADDWAVLLARGRLVFKAPADGPAAMRTALGGDTVVVSESFSMRFGAGVGNAVTLPTPNGPRSFRVAGVYYDYSTDRGVALMDRAAFTRHYGAARPTSLSVYLKPGSDANLVRQRLLAAVGSGHRVFIHTNASLRAEVLRIFDATFAITYGLEAVAILVAMLGMAGTLITLVIERRREIGILRLVGADAGQVTRAMMIESGLLGAASQAIGLPVGFLLSLLLIDVVNVQSFGWTIQFHVPVAFLVQVMAVLLLVTTLAGLYPARMAARVMTLAEGDEE